MLESSTCKIPCLAAKSAKAAVYLACHFNFGEDSCISALFAMRIWGFALQKQCRIATLVRPHAVKCVRTLSRTLPGTAKAASTIAGRLHRVTALLTLEVSKVRRIRHRLGRARAQMDIGLDDCYIEHINMLIRAGDKP